MHLRFDPVIEHPINMQQSHSLHEFFVFCCKTKTSHRMNSCIFSRIILHSSWNFAILYIYTYIHTLPVVLLYTVQEIIKLTFDCRITPVMSGVKCPLLLKITPVAHFVRIQQNYGCAILNDAS